MKVIFDLDGTIADIKHRRHLVEGKNPDWPEFFKQCVNDTPNESIIEILNSLSLQGHRIWILSGRSDIVMEETRDWLSKHGVKYDEIIMRPAGNKIPDTELKAKMVHWYGFNPDNTLCVFDDRDRLVKFWRKEGFTCLQVAEGNF